MKKIEKCYLIGVFPPPYGGVTVKSALFCELLERNAIKVERINAYELQEKRRAVHVVLRCIKAFLSGKPIVYCLDSKRLKYFLFLQTLVRSSLERTTVVAMGGIFPNIISLQRGLKSKLRNVRGIWVETEKMKRQMEHNGFSNIDVFPNPKFLDGCCQPRVSKPETPLKLVFFSQISREKGAYDVMELVKLLDENKGIDYELDFWGHIVPDMKEDFHQFVAYLAHVRYMGIFDSVKAGVYRCLNEYDVLLFPTRWTAEGIPGVLIEAKMSGLAVIASDKNNNCEIIQPEKEEGFLVKENYPKEMCDIICRLAADRDLLFKIKQGSYRSRVRYSMEKYESMIDNL